eukprot:COSAG06_NODE_1367_length_9687_cov_6.213496_8_plen_101_part_00
MGGTNVDIESGLGDVDVESGGGGGAGAPRLGGVGAGISAREMSPRVSRQASSDVSDQWSDLGGGHRGSGHTEEEIGSYFGRETRETGRPIPIQIIFRLIH